MVVCGDLNISRVEISKRGKDEIVVFAMLDLLVVTKYASTVKGRGNRCR